MRLKSMKLIPFILRKEKIIKRNLIIALAIIVFLVLLGLGSYFLFQKKGWGLEFNFGAYFQKLAAGLATLKEKAEEIKKEEEPKLQETEAPSPTLQPKIYEQTAESGEGITHLARKALKEYLKDKGEEQNLTPEHKIYIEDYLQNRIGERWLKVGEKVTFSEELIKEAVEKSQQLTDVQLKNLKQYSILVPSL